MSLRKTADAELGSDPYPGQEPQRATEREQFKEGLGQENWNPAEDYKFVFINGQFHYSPTEDYKQLAKNAGTDLDYTGPMAVGQIHFFMGKADFETQTNLDSGALRSILEEFCTKRHIQLGAITDLSGHHIGKKSSLRAYYYESGPELLLSFSSKKLSKVDGSIYVENNVARVFGSKCKDILALYEWAKDNNIKIASDYGGFNNTIKTLEDIDQDNLYTPEWKNPEDHLLTTPQPNQDPPKGPMKCDNCGEVFPDYKAWMEHMTYEENPEDEINQDGHFPDLDMDAQFPPHFHEREWGLDHFGAEKPPDYPIPFIYDPNQDAVILGNPEESSDIMGASYFEPDGLVRGLYEGGKLIIEPIPNMPVSYRHILNLWVYSPYTEHLPLKSVFLKEPDGSDTKISKNRI